MIHFFVVLDYGDIVRPNLANQYNAGFTEQLNKCNTALILFYLVLHEENLTYFLAIIAFPKVLQQMDPSDLTSQAQAEA